MRRMVGWTVLLALLALGPSLHAERLLATETVTATNVDWMALARALRASQKGENVEFVWQDYPAASYGEIRRALWLAALHGITNHVCRDRHTRRLLSEERLRAMRRIETPFSLDVAVRSGPSADRLYLKFLKTQTSCLLVGAEDESPLSTTLRCTGGEILNENSSLVFTSVDMAASFTHACYSDKGLVFESDGSVATDIFLRRFTDGSATIVNLSSRPRASLIYRRGHRHTTFDMTQAGVTHLGNAEPARFSRDCRETFVAGLWQISRTGSVTRLVDDNRMPLAVPEAYRGVVRYRTHIVVPKGSEALLLNLETDGAETAVRLGETPLGTRAWEPFEWEVPLNYRGRNVPLEIFVRKQTVKGCLQTTPTWRRR